MAISFLQALESAARLATQALPETLHERLDAATALVKAGAVFQDDSGHWTVASTSTPDKRYSVNGSCSCEDAYYRAPEGRCKHKLAQLLARKTQALLTVAQTGTEVPADPQAPEVELNAQSACSNQNNPLYEAPASVNCHITISGRQVQLTLRDHDEGRLLTRLQTVLAQYPAPQPPSAPAPSQGEGYCHVHQVQMKRHENAKGVWYSHYFEGRHCKGK